MNEQYTEPTSAVLAQSGKPGKYKCAYAGCDAGFDTPQGLSLHIVRVHTHRFGRGYKKKTAEQVKAAKRAYNAKLRADNIARGLTSSGTTRIRPLAKSYSQQYKKQKYREQVARYRAQGLNAHGQPFSARIGRKGRKNIRAAQAKRRAKEAAENMNGAQLAQSGPDQLGESARAIIMASQVLRSVAVGLKI